MHLSDELEVIWLTPQRTGTRSTIYLLKELHFQIGAHNWEIPKEKSHYKIVCNVRNPYSRLTSIFFLQSLHLKNFDRDFKTWVFSSFEDKYFFQNYQINFHENLPPVDFYVKIENFIDSIFLLSFINFDDSTIKKTLEENILTNHYKDEFSEFITRKDWKQYYDEELASFVYEKLKIQFDMFKYEKNSWYGTP